MIVVVVVIPFHSDEENLTDSLRYQYLQSTRFKSVRIYHSNLNMPLFKYFF